MTPRITTLFMALCLTSPAWSYWQPVSPLKWQIQLSGPINTSVDASVYALDAFDIPTATITNLHNQGKKVMCLFSAGTYENWRNDAAKFPKTVIGNANGSWAGENWLDIRSLATLGPIMKARLDLAKSKGCDGIVPTNVEGYTKSTGFPLTSAHQITFNTFLATEAHARNMAIGLMDDIAQIPSLVSKFDYALTESCYSNQQCDRLSPFTTAKKPVFNIEYTATTAQFCSSANQLKINSIRKNPALDAYVASCPTTTTPPPVTPPPVTPPPVTPPPVTPPPVTPPPPTTGWWAPHGQYSWQIQFSGTIDPSMDSQVNFVDLVGTSASRMAQIHTKGGKVVCYISAGAVNMNLSGSSVYPASVLGTEQASWPNVFWLDVRRTDVLIPIMGAHIASAKQKGCDAMMLDNSDVHTQKSGFPITPTDNLNYLKALADEAHRQGLGIGMNNNQLQIPALINHMDFGINESCMSWNECGLEKPFITAGKSVFQIEYSADISAICSLANSYGFSALKKNKQLDAWRQTCR